MIDAHGKKHLFIDKVPVVALRDLDADSIYPTDGVIGCEVIKGSDDPATDIVTVSTERPWYIQSTEEVLVFDVQKEQLMEITSESYKD